MATDFNLNSSASKGGFKPSSTDTPLDIRCRVETEADIMSIPKPYIGMVIYVKDTGKRFEVLSLKDIKAGLSVVKNAAVNEYRELIVSYNDLADKPEIPNIEGLATENFVNEGLANKVDKAEGKSLIDDAEIARLADVDNYDDAEIRGILANKADKSELFNKDYNDLVNKPEIPSIEGLASENFVNEGLTNKVDKVEGKSLVDDAEIARLANVDNYDDAEIRGILANKADKSELFSKDYNDLTNKPEIPSIEGLATENFVNEGLGAKVDKVEGKSLVDDAEIERLANVDNYELPVATNEELGGVKAGSNIQITQDGVINGANYQFQVNMIENGFEPSVEMVGEFPNITVIFNLPKCYPVMAGPANSKMWYGYIPYDETGVAGFSETNHINGNMTYDIMKFGIDNGSLIEAEPEAVGSVELEVPANGFICVILPVDSTLVASMDEGNGKKCSFTEFDTVSGLSLDNVELVNEIDGIKYRLSGMYDTNGGANYTIHIDEN